MTIDKRWLVRGAIAIAVAVAAFLIWQLVKPGDLPDGIVSGNGRIEAVEIDVSAKAPGRTVTSSPMRVTS